MEVVVRVASDGEASELIFPYSLEDESVRFCPPNFSLAAQFILISLATVSGLGLQQDGRPVIRRPYEPSPSPSPKASDPRFEQAIQRGDKLASIGDLTGAQAQYRAAIQLSSRSSLAHYRIAEILFRQANYQSADEEYRQAISGDGNPRWTEVWSYLQLGKISDLDGHREDAKNEYRQALQTNDNSQGALAQARGYLDAPFTARDIQAQPSANQSSFGNDDVMRLVAAGVPDAVVIEKIRSCKCKLDTSTDAIIKLQRAGVSPAVIRVMISPNQSSEANHAAGKAADSNNDADVQDSTARRTVHVASKYPTASIFRKAVLPSSATPYDAASLYWSQYYYHCGDSHFLEWWNKGYFSEITQYRGVHWNAVTEPLSEADRLNGVQWRGKSYLSASAMRVAPRHKPWSPWGTAIGMQVSMEKTNGKWTITSYGGGFGPTDQNMSTDCTRVQAILRTVAAKTQEGSALGPQLIAAIVSKDYTKAQQVLHQGADPDASDGARTALMLAVRTGDARFVRALIEHGGDVNARGDHSINGITVLEFAMKYGTVEIVKLLLEGGADPQLTDGFGKTPQEYAREQGDPEILELVTRQ